MTETTQKEVKREKQDRQTEFQKLFKEHVGDMLTYPKMFQLRDRFMNSNPEFLEYILECALQEPHLSTIIEGVLKNRENLIGFYYCFGENNINNTINQQITGEKLMEKIYSVALKEPHYSRIIKNSFDLSALGACMGEIEFVNQARALYGKTSHAAASAQFGAQAEAARAAPQVDRTTVPDLTGPTAAALN